MDVIETGSSPVRAGGIDFGVVNFNGGPALVRCVRSILSQEGPACRVWVLDNGSTDGSPAALEREIEDPRDRVTVIRAGENLGYAGALNRLLGELETPVVVLSNMDVEYEPGWAAAVARRMDETSADAVATVVLEATEPAVVNSLGVRFWGDLHAQNVGSGEVYRPGTVVRDREQAFGSYGAVMCVRRDAAEAVGFDASYFLFFEETDFFLRFHLLGHEIAFAADAIARHQRSLSTRRYSLLKLYYGERNRLTTVFKLLPVSYWPVAFVHTLRRLVRLARAQGAETNPERGSRDAPAREPPPRLPPTWEIVRTLIRAWGAAVIRLPRTLRFRRAFWRRTPASPRDALALVRRYRLSASELRLR